MRVAAAVECSKPCAREFQIEFVSHAEAILRFDFPDVARDLESVLANSSIPIEEIIRSGGGETKATQRLRRALVEKGWRKHKFEIVRTIDGVRREAISHEIDHMARYDKGVIALEINGTTKILSSTAISRISNACTPTAPSLSGSS